MALELGSRRRGYSLKMSISEAILRLGGTVAVRQLVVWRYESGSRNGELVEVDRKNIGRGGRRRAVDSR